MAWVAHVIREPPVIQRSLLLVGPNDSGKEQLHRATSLLLPRGSVIHNASPALDRIKLGRNWQDVRMLVDEGSAEMGLLYTWATAVFNARRNAISLALRTPQLGAPAMMLRVDVDRLDFELPTSTMMTQLRSESDAIRETLAKYTESPYRMMPSRLPQQLA